MDRRVVHCVVCHLKSTRCVNFQNVSYVVFKIIGKPKSPNPEVTKPKKAKRDPDPLLNMREGPKEKVYMLLQGMLVKMMVRIDTKLYCKYIFYASRGY